KISKDGKILWKRFYDSGKDYDHAESVVQARDGGYILVGKAAGDYFWVIKTDEKGREIWNKTYGGGSGKEIIRGIDGGYVIAGFTDSYGAGGYDAFFIKIDENGNIIWKRTWGGFDMDEARCIVATEDGYVATGYTDDFNFLILKLDKDGNVVWSNTRVKSCDIGEGITVCPDGYAAVGFNGDACLIRFDENGNEMWHRYFGGNDPNDGALSVLYDNGYFMLAGYYATNIIANHSGPFLIKCPDKKPENVSIEITRPRPKYLYVFDREIMPYKKTLIIGDIRVVAELHGNGKRVEFYLCDGPDNLDGYTPVKVVYSPPYEWNWNTGDMRLKNFWTPTPYYIAVRTYFGDEESAAGDILLNIYKWM
ncbi:MAG: PQQ-binding-like beta-propeller repeat protein, partial [Thermoplasmata archaeon]|nr:PQQ-binding-like beta-propeller repeat protein [Thermoplasmata archaeon]